MNEQYRPAVDTILSILIGLLVVVFFFSFLILMFIASAPVVDIMTK